MNIIVIYATYSSGTQTASELIAELLKKSQHSVTLTNAQHVDPSSLLQYDLIILGSPSWMIEEKDGQPHHLMGQLMKKMEGMMVQKPFAVFGLGDSEYARFCGAVTHLEEFVKKLQGTLVIDSLKIDGFYFRQEENEKHIAQWVNNILNAIQKPAPILQ